MFLKLSLFKVFLLYYLDDLEKQNSRIKDKAYAFVLSAKAKYSNYIYYLLSHLIWLKEHLNFSIEISK